MCSPAHFHSTIVTRVCDQQIMVIYNLLLFSYHAASYLKKGSLFRVCTHFGFIQLLSLLHLQPKLPDRCVAIAM